jgi:hypothetical protein
LSAFYYFFSIIKHRFNASRLTWRSADIGALSAFEFDSAFGRRLCSISVTECLLNQNVVVLADVTGDSPGGTAGAELRGDCARPCEGKQDGCCDGGDESTHCDEVSCYLEAEGRWILLISFRTACVYRFVWWRRAGETAFRPMFANSRDVSESCLLIRSHLEAWRICRPLFLRSPMTTRRHLWPSNMWTGVKAIV